MEKFCFWLFVISFALCPFVLAQQNKDKKAQEKNKPQTTATPQPTPQPTLMLPDEQRHLQEAGTVLKEILNMPDYIPQPLLNKTESILVFPSLNKFPIVIRALSGPSP